MNRTNWWKRLVDRKFNSQRRCCRLDVEQLEARCLLDAGVRSITGFGNNIDQPTFGQAGTDLIRVSPVAYADGISAPSTPNTLSPRQISNNLNNQSDPIFSGANNLGVPQTKDLSDFAYVWGQFIDHDMDLTTTTSGQSFDIPADPTRPNDPMGVEPFTRSTFDATTGTTFSANLADDVNRVGIVTDGSIFLSGGLDGDGNALSANLLGSSVTFNGATYALGAAGVNDVISASGQAVTLPTGNASSLSFLATGVNGNQANQTFTVTYTDGSTQSFTRSISDWFTPQGFPGEAIAVTMPYRDTHFGGRDHRTFDVYGYSFTLDGTRQVQSITLPNNSNVEIIAIDLTPTIARQQVNANTSFLDLSQVYGSTDFVADALRTHSGGQLKTSPGNLLPFNNTTYFTPAQLMALNMANDAHQVPDTSLYAAGDVRANENIELTAIQTLFMRNHNSLAQQLQSLHPAWSDEQLYQEARKLNIAEEEIITYNEFLPAILGPNALPAYNGYNDDVNPSIATEFSTVGFRFGHSLLSDAVGRHKNDGTDIFDVNPDGADINLAADFFDPNLITPNGATDPLTNHTSSNIGAILKADADGTANELDLLLIDEVRNVLFGIPQGPGTDLAARDIQRTRDHGIGTYNQVRVAFGLPAVTSFAQITSDVTVQQQLQATYGTVDQIDPFEGMLAEDHLSGADVGPTIKAILANQFTRLRDGDRFFYLNESFNNQEVNLVGQGNSLAKVIENNTAITNLQSNVFFFKVSIRGTVFDDDNHNGVLDTGEPGVAGVTVNLNDDSGTVVASTTTDSQGHYLFTDQTGIPGTGNFTVTIFVPSGFRQTSTNPGTIFLSRGGLNMTGVNFGIDETLSSGGFLAPASAGGSGSSGLAGAAAPAGTGSSDSNATPASSSNSLAALANTAGLGSQPNSAPASTSSGSSAPTSSGAISAIDVTGPGAQPGTSSSVWDEGGVPASPSSSSGQPASLLGDDPNSTPLL